MGFPPEGKIDVKVYYEDTDCLGMVYYANYLKYFERGRTELISSLGQPISEMNRSGYNLAVFKVAVTYHKPAKLQDQCHVVTRPKRGKSEFRLIMEQELYLGDELLTEAEVQIVCLDDDMELQELPPVLQEWRAAVAS